MAATFQAKDFHRSVTSSMHDSQPHNAIEDLKMEYQMKYERLVKLYQDSLEAFATANKSAEVHQNAYQSYVKELKNSGFEKDMKIYNLEGELRNLESKYADLQNKYNELDAKMCQSTEEKTNNNQHPSPKMEGFKVAQKTPVVETPIILSSVPKIDIASPLLLPETPCRVSRQKRFSIINETLDKATPSDEKEKHAFLRGVIVDLKELLDFYATITGFAAWKEKVEQNANETQSSLDFFKMKPQRENVKDMELQFIVDYDVDDIEYRPINIPNQIKESLESVAPYMKENLYFSSENAPKLLKTLLDVIES